MRIVKRCLLSLSILFSVAAAQAQTVDDIIQKHLTAIGGKEKLTAIQSVRMEHTMQIMGNEAPTTMVVLNGKGYRSESEFNGQKMIQVFTEQGGWAINPMAGGTDPEPMSEGQFNAGKDQIYVVPFLDYAAKGNKAELMGLEKVGSVNAYKIRLVDKNNLATTFYFDPATYYIIQSVKSAEMMGQQMEVVTTYADHKKTDYGWVVPHAMEINLGGQFSLTAKLNKIEVNTPVDASLFEMKK